MGKPFCGNRRVNILNTGIVTVNSIKSFNAGSPLTSGRCNFG
jgi:hypothetical protein